MAFNDTFTPNPATAGAGNPGEYNPNPANVLPSQIISAGTRMDGTTTIAAADGKPLPPAARFYNPSGNIGGGHYRGPVAVPDNTLIGTDSGKTPPYAGFNQAMIETAPAFELMMQASVAQNPRWWHDRIPRRAYQLFNGIAHEQVMFRGAKLKYAGLDEWEDIDPYPSATNNPCGALDFTTPTYSWEAISYRGKRAAWGSDPICAEQFKYFAQAQQQLAWIIAAGAEYGIQMQEVWNRDMFIYQSVLRKRAFVMSSEYTGKSTDARFVYDPFIKFDGTSTYKAGHANLSDAVVKAALGNKGGAFALMDASLECEPLNFDMLDKVRESLKIRCPNAAVSRSGGSPIFSLNVSKGDVDKYVRGNEEERRLWIEAKPEALISHYDFTAPVFRQWMITEDGNQLRFKRVMKIAGCTDSQAKAFGLSAADVAWATGKDLWVLKAVDPFTEASADDRPGMNGTKVLVDNPEYIDAELAVATVFMNNVFTNEFAPSITSLGSGTSFGPAVGLNGVWRWINIQDRVTNPEGNVGNFYGKFEIFAKPDPNVFNVICFMYRRCSTAFPSKCPVQNAHINTTPKVTASKLVGAANIAENATAVIRLADWMDLKPGDTLKIGATESAKSVTVIAVPTMHTAEVFASTATGALADGSAVALG